MTTYQDYEGYIIYDPEWFREDILTIAVDFDGTCVEHEYPLIGKEIGAARVLKMLSDRGHKLILFTMRSGKFLQDAVKWFDTHDIPLYSVQTNPTQISWTSSPKCYAHMYIDDAALGCPLCFGSKRPFVDWKIVEMMLIQRNVL